MWGGVCNSPAPPPPLGAPTGRSSGRSLSKNLPSPESAKPASSRQTQPAPPWKISLSTGEGRWRGEEGQDQKKPQSPSQPTSPCPTKADPASTPPHKASSSPLTELPLSAHRFPTRQWI